MWAIRILSGPQAGQIFPLRTGQHRIGRGPTCEVKIASNSVSKEHATVLVTEDKIIITDLNSRNGTFVNGVRIQNQRLSFGDKLSLHDVLLDILQLPDNISPHQPIIPVGGIYQPAAPAWAGNAAVRLQHQHQHQQHQAHHPHPSAGHIPAPGAEFDPSSLQAAYAGQEPGVPHDAAPRTHAAPANDLLANVQVYIDNVAMPGIYAMAQQMPFRWALAGLVLVFVLAVTSLSLIPTVTTTKQNIQEESIRRAKTIARNMRDSNKRLLAQNNEMAIDIRSAELEEGVTAALIINAKDGTIIAPANKRGEYANRPFVNKARREDREVAEFIDDSSLGVAVPITFYSAETGKQAIAAYAIVLYDSGAMAMNADQTFALFIKTFAIALLVGGALFFFLFKIVEHPIESINLQLDDALREGRDDLRTPYQFPALENLVSNVNSALSRIGQTRDAGSSPAPIVNRDIEASNIVRMLPHPAIAINAIDERIISVNNAFTRLIGGGVDLQGRPLNEIPDIALQQNLADLLPNMRASAGELALSEIPFPDAKYEVCGQAVMGSHEPAYYLVTLNRMGDDG